MKLQLYNEPKFKGQKFTKPPAEIVDGFPEFEVENILDSKRIKRGRNNKLYYLVHWKGYSPEEDSWEPVEGLTNAQELIDKFHKRHLQAIN